MSRRPVIAGNWKMNKTPEEAVKDASEKAKRGGIGKEEVIALFEKHFESEVVNDNSRNKES